MKRTISDAFFDPNSIAIIGATKKPGFGFGLPEFLINRGFKDRLYLVNPREKEIAGLPVYTSVTEVPGEVDLAIVMVPAPAVPEVIQGCLNKNIRSIILESAGFSETGPDGAKLEKDVADMVKNTETRIIGPNCVGTFNLHNKFAAANVLFDVHKAGGIGVVAQSGAFGNILMDWAPSQNLAFSKVATIGNRLDVTEVDMLYYMAQDDLTKVICIYMEGVKDGKGFIEAATEVSRMKPVLILKSGRTEAGKGATASHTGSMAGDDAIYEAVFRQTGVIRAKNYIELFDMAKVMSTQPIPEGANVGIVTSSGSIGAMTTDCCIDIGLNLPQYSGEMIDLMKEKAPGWMNVRNPLDVGPSGLFGDAVEAALSDSNINSLILIPVIPFTALKNIMGLGGDLSLVYGPIVETRKKFPGKPIVSLTMGSEQWQKLLVDFYGDSIPLVSSPEIAARTIYEMYRFGLHRAGAQLD